MDFDRLSRLVNEVQKLISAIAPIDGFALVDIDNIDTWRIDFREDATEEQRSAALEALKGFDLNSVDRELIKSEARRRILLVMSEDQQRNALAATQAATLNYGTDPETWPNEARERQESILADWAEIERIRKRSNELEQIQITVPITTDDLWS